MKELVMIGVAAAVLLSAGWVATNQFDDRQLFTPPPDAVAEGFMREVVTRRLDRALNYLPDSNAETEPLRLLADSIEERLGHVDDVQAETITSTDDEALVRVTLRSAKGSATLVVKTVWEKGGWKAADVTQGA